VILIPSGVRILLAAQPVDFRKGMDGLAALVQQALRADPFAGDVFIFRARRGDRPT
jgi:transposase